MKFLMFFILISMNLIASVSIGKDAKNFILKNEEGNKVELKDYKGKTIVLEWLNYGCPFVKKHYDSGNMQALQKKYQDQVVWLSIISSAEGKQGYSTPSVAKSMKEEKGSNAKFVLLDTKGEVGMKYGAKTTPHMFIIGKDFKVIYQGAIDSIASTDKDDIEKAEDYISSALDSHFAGKEIKVAKSKSYGCSVKY